MSKLSVLPGTVISFIARHLLQATALFLLQHAVVTTNYVLSPSLLVFLFLVPSCIIFEILDKLKLYHKKSWDIGNSSHRDISHEPHVLPLSPSGSVMGTLQTQIIQANASPKPMYYITIIAKAILFNLAIQCLFMAFKSISVLTFATMECIAVVIVVIISGILASFGLSMTRVNNNATTGSGGIGVPSALHAVTRNLPKIQKLRRGSLIRGISAFILGISLIFFRSKTNILEHQLLKESLRFASVKNSTILKDFRNSRLHTVKYLHNHRYSRNLLSFSSYADDNSNNDVENRKNDVFHLISARNLHNISLSQWLLRANLQQQEGSQHQRRQQQQRGEKHSQNTSNPTIRKTLKEKEPELLILHEVSRHEVDPNSEEKQINGIHSSLDQQNSKRENLDLESDARDVSERNLDAGHSAEKPTRNSDPLEQASRENPFIAKVIQELLDEKEEKEKEDRQRRSTSDSTEGKESSEDGQFSSHRDDIVPSSQNREENQLQNEDSAHQSLANANEQNFQFVSHSESEAETEFNTKPESYAKAEDENETETETETESKTESKLHNKAELHTEDEAEPYQQEDVQTPTEAKTESTERPFSLDKFLDRKSENIADESHDLNENSNLESSPGNVMSDHGLNKDSHNAEKLRRKSFQESTEEPNSHNRVEENFIKASGSSFRGRQMLSTYLQLDKQQNKFLVGGSFAILFYVFKYYSSPGKTFRTPYSTLRDYSLTLGLACAISAVPALNWFRHDFHMLIGAALEMNTFKKACIEIIIASMFFFIIPQIFEDKFGKFASKTRYPLSVNGLVVSISYIFAMTFLFQRRQSLYMTIAVPSILLGADLVLFSHHAEERQHLDEFLQRDSSLLVELASESYWVRHSILSDCVMNCRVTLRKWNQSIRYSVHCAQAEKESRQLFSFLIFQVSMMLIEAIYGQLTNSVGLISASSDTLICCISLTLGLYAHELSTRKENDVFTYGYRRIEALIGFTNGILLLFVGCLISLESLWRLFEPPEIESARVLVISAIGFFCNLLGLTLFSQESRTRNLNVMAAFIHIFANTLSSLAMMLSAILSESLGWTSSDIILSILTSIAVFISSYPIIKRSAPLLLLRIPEGKDREFERWKEKMLQTEGVRHLSSIHWWEMAPKSYIFTIRLSIEEECSEQIIRTTVRKYLEEELGVLNAVIQIQKGSHVDERALDRTLTVIDQTPSAAYSTGSPLLM